MLCLSDILFVNPMRYSSFVGPAADEWCLIVIIAYFGTFLRDKIATVWVPTI